MATEKKAIILFAPQYLKDGFGFLDFFYAMRKANTVDFVRPHRTSFLAEFDFIPDHSAADLQSLTDAALAKLKADWQDSLGRSAQGKQLEEILQRKILRFIFDLFKKNYSIWKTLPWYHQVKDPIKKNIRKGPCSLEQAPVRLVFQVNKGDHGALRLDRLVQIGKLTYSFADFTQYLFFIEFKNQYFFLEFQDYLMLDFLDQQAWNHLAFKPKEFFKEIVIRLESKGYDVDRNGAFKVQPIQAAPVGRVLVSEIGHAFLQFIPAFSYEGIVIDSPYQPYTEVERQGELFRIHRDKSAEQAIIHQIQSCHPNFASQFNLHFFIPFEAAKKNNWFLKTYQSWVENGLEIIGLEWLEHFRYSTFKPETEIHWISSEHGLSTIEFKVQFGPESIRIKEIQKIIHSGQKSILLQDQTIGVFPDEWLLQYAVFLKHANVISAYTLTISDRLLQWLEHPEIQKNQEKIIPADWQQKWKAWQQQDHPVYAVDDRLTVKLRPYQQKGYEWLCLLSELGSGACLADDMGLGKSLQTICFLIRQHQLYPAEKQIIICPASLIYNWKAEFEKMAPWIEVTVYRGGVEELSEFFLSDSSPVLVCSYGTVRSQVEYLSKKQWNAVVVDESHHIKNPSALITRAVQSLLARSRIALSGTPVMNNTFDLYAQFDFLIPGFLGGPEFFRKEYADPIDKDGDTHKSKLLHRLTAPYILRRTKAQVAQDLPEKTVSILWCEMEEKQRALYQEIKSQIRTNLLNSIKSVGINKAKIGVLEGLMKLKRICDSTSLLTSGVTTEIHSIKLNVLIDELANQLTQNKVLVFSQFKGMLFLIADRLKALEIPYYHFDGDTKTELRLPMVEAFNRPEDPARVFLISLKAGNTGLNLTAADYVFLVDPWWNTSVEDQAIDRSHRIGQTKHVMAYKMICKDSIEEKIMQLQNKKSQTAESLVKTDQETKSFTDVEVETLFSRTEEGFIKNLSEGDIDFLFS
jgi:superfamily II DNA or RNA helicase